MHQKTGPKSAVSVGEAGEARKSDSEKHVKDILAQHQEAMERR